MSTTAVVAAVYANHEAIVHQKSAGQRRLVTFLAVLVVAAGWAPTLLGVSLIPGSFRSDIPGGVLLAALLIGTVGAATLWMALVYAWSGVPPARALWRGFGLASLGGLGFTAEAFSLGFLLFGQLLAIPIPIVVGLQLRKRLRNRE